MNFEVQTLNNISKRGLKLLDENYTVADAVEAPDAILVRSAKMHDMDIPESVKFIGRAGAGVNNIPIDKCSELGIVVCNSPGANANAVKELVALGMLMSSRKVVDGVEWTKTLLSETGDVGAAVEKGKKAFVGPELYGKKMGVVGLGAIGVLVANMAVDFGMKVYGFDPYLSIEHAWGLSRKVKRSTSKEAIFKNCDYISLHIPFMEETKNFVDADILKETKKGLRLMNIVNSVNYPNCSMGVCNSVHRITVNHRNIPNMIGQITAVLAGHNINISDMTNKNRGEWAYTMIDVDSEVGDNVKEALKTIEGVTRVRVLK